MSIQRFTHPDPSAAAEACARHITGLLEEALSGQDLATLAVSGGSTPRLLFERLSASPFHWERVHLFWVDERCVPPQSPESNYRLAEQHLITPARISQRQVHRIRGELLPEVAAHRYESEIREFFGLDESEFPRFDVIQYGMGADAHTASLFPGEPLIADRERIAGAVHVEKLSKWRVTLLPGALLRAKHSVVLVTGADKAEAVGKVFQSEYAPNRYPAQLIARQCQRVSWFLDQPAAALID